MKLYEVNKDAYEVSRLKLNSGSSSISGTILLFLGLEISIFGIFPENHNIFEISR